MARNPAERRRPTWLRILLFGLLAVGCLAAAAIIVPPMFLTPSSEVALIKAEPGPFKEKPADPGGAEIPHTDSTVMTMLGGLVEQDEDVEILRPPADVPEMPPLPPAGETRPAVADEPTPPAGVAVDEVRSAAPDNVTEVAATEEAPVSAAVTDDAVPDTDNQAQEPDMAVPMSKPAPPKRVKVEGDEPLYLVQLAAFRNAATAREQAGLLSGKHQTRLAEVELGTMKVDAGENGIFWRVVTEPLARLDADALCASLKRAGQECILRKFTEPSS
ncbi:MAG: SPOR domain-containing protein [Pseudomonadota bacterium]|nr:SPOR domain-containing protein [Pseudomonadota bacterium]